MLKLSLVLRSWPWHLAVAGVMAPLPCVLCLFVCLLFFLGGVGIDVD